MTFLAYMCQVANLNYQLNYVEYQQFDDDSFFLYMSQISRAVTSNELAAIHAELIEWCS